MSRLNPFLDAGPWGSCTIGGLLLPGVIASIDGAEKPEEWAVQKGTSGNNAVTVWKGTTLAETIKILLQLATIEAFDAYYDVQAALRPKLGTKPPSLVLTNAAINFAGITRIACRNVGTPKWVPAGGYWTGLVELIEYNPSKPAATGQATPANPGQQFGPPPPPTANEVAEAQLTQLLNEAATL